MKRRAYELIEVITVGLPFCAFKVLTGTVLQSRAWLAPAGWALVSLGLVDSLLNLANLGALALGRSRVVGVCCTQLLVRWRKPKGGAWDDLGISIDIALSFALVALVIGFGLLPTLSPVALHVWNVAVVLNVLGAGFGRLSSSLGSLRETPRIPSDVPEGGSP